MKVKNRLNKNGLNRRKTIGILLIAGATLAISYLYLRDLTFAPKVIEKELDIQNIQ